MFWYFSLSTLLNPGVEKTRIGIMVQDNYMCEATDVHRHLSMDTPTLQDIVFFFNYINFRNLKTVYLNRIYTFIFTH